MPRLAPSELIDLLSGKDTQVYNHDQSSFGCHDESNQFTNAKPAETNNSPNNSKNNSWSAILFGQSIALALSCANSASSTLENDYQIKVPTSLTGLVYLILSFHLMRLFWRHATKQKDGNCEMIEDNPSYHQKLDNMQQLSVEYSNPSSFNSTNSTIRIRPPHTFPFTNLPLHTPWHTYLLLSILDVEANYLAMLSFQHTSLSSSMLLTSLSVLSTVLLRRVIFHSTIYGRTKLLGIIMCLIGGCLWLREEFNRGGPELDSDSRGTFHAAKQSPLYVLQGDLLALSAAVLYGLNDVLAEYFVKTNNDKVEYLGMLGFFGSAFSFLIQVPMLEKDSLQQLFAGVGGDINFDHVGNGDSSTSTMGAIFLLLCFIIMLSYFYISVMSFLSVYDATILNLSLQSCPLWAVFLTMGQKSLSADNRGSIALPPVMFFVSLTMVVVGMFLYESNSGNERSGSDVNEIDSSSDALC